MGPAIQFRQPPRSARVDRHPAGRRVLAEAVRVRRPRLSGRRRLHGPGQLGHRPGRRRALRLHAAQRDPDFQPDGDPAAGARRAAGHRQRPRSRAGVPRQLLAAGHDLPLDPLRDRDCRVRPRGSDRRGDRAEPALRPAAHLGRVAHRARRADRAVPSAQGLPLRRGAGDRADRGDRRVLRRGTDPGAAGYGRRHGRIHSARRDPHQPRHALHRAGHPRRDGDAAQPLPPLVDRPDAEVPRHAGPASAKRSGLRRSIRRWR